MALKMNHFKIKKRGKKVRRYQRVWFNGETKVAAVLLHCFLAHSCSNGRVLQTTPFTLLTTPKIQES